MQSNDTIANLPRIDLRRTVLRAFRTRYLRRSFLFIKIHRARVNEILEPPRLHIVFTAVSIPGSRGRKIFRERIPEPLPFPNWSTIRLRRRLSELRVQPMRPYENKSLPTVRKSTNFLPRFENGRPFVDLPVPVNEVSWPANYRADDFHNFAFVL